MKLRERGVYTCSSIVEIVKIVRERAYGTTAFFGESMIIFKQLPKVLEPF